VEVRRADGSIGVKMIKYDIVIKDKYKTGFGSTLKFVGKTEEEIAAIIDHYNGLTPDIKNRWRVLSKKALVA
jgi:hypothetical protein